MSAKFTPLQKKQLAALRRLHIATRKAFFAANALHDLFPKDFADEFSIPLAGALGGISEEADSFAANGATNHLLARTTITPEWAAALGEIRQGASVYSTALARTLRTIQRHRPNLLTLTNEPADQSGMKPFFGAILTTEGAAVLVHAEAQFAADYAAAKKGGR